MAIKSRRRTEATRSKPAEPEATLSKAAEPYAVFRALLAHRHKFRWNTQPPLRPNELAEMDALIARVSTANKTRSAVHDFFTCIGGVLTSIYLWNDGQLRPPWFFTRMLPGIELSGTRWRREFDRKYKEELLSYLHAYPNGELTGDPNSDIIESYAARRIFCFHNYDRYGEVFLWSMWEAYDAITKRSGWVDGTKWPNRNYFPQDMRELNIGAMKASALAQANKTRAEQTAEIEEAIRHALAAPEQPGAPVAQVIRRLKLLRKSAVAKTASEPELQYEPVRFKEATTRIQPNPAVAKRITLIKGGSDGLERERATAEMEETWRSVTSLLDRGLSLTEIHQRSGVSLQIIKTISEVRSSRQREADTQPEKTLASPTPGAREAPRVELTGKPMPGTAPPQAETPTRPAARSEGVKSLQAFPLVLVQEAFGELAVRANMSSTKLLTKIATEYVLANVGSKRRGIIKAALAEDAQRKSNARRQKKRNQSKRSLRCISDPSPG